MVVLKRLGVVGVAFDLPLPPVLGREQAVELQAAGHPQMPLPFDGKAHSLFREGEAATELHDPERARDVEASVLWASHCRYERPGQKY